MATVLPGLKPLAFAALLVISLATPALAGPVAVCEDNAPLQDYIALGATGCTIGTLRFYNFDYQLILAIAAAPVLAADVIVHTHSGANPGFTFEGEWYSTFVGFLQQSLSYTVEPLAGAPNIVGAGLSFHAYAGGAVGAFASVLENVCQGGVFPGCAGGIPGNLFVSTSTTPQAFSPFAAVPILGVHNILTVDGGTGQAEIDEFSNTFRVPEPGLLLLLGISGTALMAKRRARRAAC